MNADLIQAACEGDTDAIEELLREYQPSIVRFARRYCAASDLEDAVQETLWAIYQKIGTLQSPQAFVSWTFRIVRNHCYRLLSSGKHDAEMLTLDRLTLIEHSGDEAELREDVINALARIPFAYRQILIMRDIEGYTAPQVAEALGITVETVKSRLHRGRNLLREMLAHWVS
jgi:RNA polymerase sigma factor (sigma-70 family)